MKLASYFQHRGPALLVIDKIPDSEILTPDSADGPVGIATCGKEYNCAWLSEVEFLDFADYILELVDKLKGS